MILLESISSLQDLVDGEVLVGEVEPNLDIVSQSESGVKLICVR